MIATHCILQRWKMFPRLVRSSPAQWLSQVVVSGCGCLCCTPLLCHCKSTLETDMGCDGPSSWSFILGAPKLFQWRNNVLWKPDSREFQFPPASPQTSFHVYLNITSAIMLGKQKSFIHRMQGFISETGSWCSFFLTKFSKDKRKIMRNCMIMLYVRNGFCFMLLLF